MTAETTARVLASALVPAPEGRPRFPCAATKRPTTAFGLVDA
jgi:hypothetical protein